MKKTLVIVSGGFDPPHEGHIALFNNAKALGDKLIVILNNNNWLRIKRAKTKIKILYPQETRKLIIENLKAVDEVILTRHRIDKEDMSVCTVLRQLWLHNIKKYNIVFANGGDRYSDNIPEYKLCGRLGITMVFNIGGEKLNSSSKLLKKWQNK